MAYKVLVLLGPTGIGKSECAIQIAKSFNMEIISADSVQVFKGFDIGSAKISEEQMQGIKHYGIDLLSPNEEFTVGDFVQFAEKKIEEISSHGKIPLIVGGTGLYVKALIEGYNFGGTTKHVEFREEMEKVYQNEGCEGLYQRLCKLNPNTNVDKFNKVRLIRAIEIATFGDEKKSQKNDKYDFKILSLTMPREKLYERINARTKQMLDLGLVQEVKNLYEKYGYCQGMRAIGYKEVVELLNGAIKEEDLLPLISQHTRNYAKRQITFIKGIEGREYFDISQNDCLEKIKKEIKSWLILQ